MIRYQLRCQDGHGFEAWFRSSDNFETQAQAGEVSCPTCGNIQIDRAPMAPKVLKQSGRSGDHDREMRQMLRTLRQSVETHCEDVGARFAEEARKIHYGETDARAIYGETTAKEVAALNDEGIEFGQIPWVPLTDA